MVCNVFGRTHSDESALVMENLKCTKNIGIQTMTSNSMEKTQTLYQITLYTAFGRRIPRSTPYASDKQKYTLKQICFFK